MGFRGEENSRRNESAQASPLLLLRAALIPALLALAAVLLWRSLGESISGTSVAEDSIAPAGPEPHVRLANATGQVRVEGVEGSKSVAYEASRYATAADPAAKQRTSEVPVDISREDSEVVIETDGGRDTGADYALKIPAGGSVEVESEAGDVEVSGLSGNVKVGAEAGDVTMRDVVEAPRGDITVADVNTDAGGAELKVASGDVYLEDLVLGTLDAGFEAGSVTLSGRISGDGRVSVETGDIIATLPAEDTRDLTLQSRIGSVLREVPQEGTNEQGYEKQEQGR